MIHWTSEIDEFLKTNYQTKSNKELAKILNIEVHNIVYRKSVLKLKKRNQSNIINPIENEIWKEIINFPKYFISSLGRLKHVTDSKEIEIKSWVNPAHGYIQTILIKDTKKVNKRVHRLVAEAFIKNLNNKEHVNHIDGVKTNNVVENLEWMTSSENQLHAVKLGLQPKISSQDNTQRKIPISIVKEVCKLIAEGKSSAEIKQSTDIGKYVSPNPFLSRIRLGLGFRDISKDYFDV
jgi:hypothetical protein